MSEQKIENLLNISMQATDSEREKSQQLSVGFDAYNRSWELIVRYTGDIFFLQTKYEGLQIEPLLNQYAILIVPEYLVEAVAGEAVIDYVEKPKRLYFQLDIGKAVSCIQSVQQDVRDGVSLKGAGTLVAVIDTGISVFNREFRNADGSTRIVNLYDQISKQELDKAQIDNILEQEKISGQRGSQTIGNDILGHGTKVAIIACGNSGVASEADIIAVKLATAVPESFPRTTQLMQALDYVVRKAVEYGKPVAINISFGNNYGDHTGSSLLENYINALSDTWKCAICIGSGNEGLGATHAGGMLSDSAEQDIEVAISAYETSVSIQIWKDYWDEFEVEIISPLGRNLGRISQSSSLQRIRAENTELLTFYGEPSPFSIRQEIYIDMIPTGEYIQEGIWILRLVPINIRNGRYDMWLPAQSALNYGTGFTRPDSSFTYTIPSAASRAISVGAYDARTRTPAAFSGRGYVAVIGGSTIVKPEIAAPGVAVELLTAGEAVTGTSYAVPFVTGSAALLMEWGIVKGNDLYLYGEKLKSYLIKGAKQLPALQEYPNPELGWGTLCVKDSIPI